MEAQLIHPRHKKDAESDVNVLQIEKLYSKPQFIAECDYQVESFNIAGLSHPSPSPLLSFEQLSQDYGRKTSDDKLGVALTTFTCFQELAPELRLMIWGMVCQQPRNIDIRLLPEVTDTVFQDGQFKYGTSKPRPDVFNVCQESRAEACKHYNVYYSTIGIKPRPRGVRFNFKADTICLDIDFELSKNYHGLEKFAAAGMSSVALNVYNLVDPGYVWGEAIESIDWTNVFHIVGAYGTRSSQLREIILYYDSDGAEGNAGLKHVGSEFVELDWSAMDAGCRKTLQLQRVQRDVLMDFPKSLWGHPDSEPRRLWGEIQSKVKLMGLRKKN